MLKYVALMIALAVPIAGPAAAAETGGWRNPLGPRQHLGSPVVETTPFVFKGRLYLLENWRGAMKVGSPRKDNTIDEIWIRDVETNQYVGRVAQRYSLSTAFVHDGRVYVFALPNDSIGGNMIHMFTSDDLKTWSKPALVVQGKPGEHFYNSAVCQGPDGFVLLIETNDKTWSPFTFRYYTNKDLNDPRGWHPLSRGLYGTDKYVGGPALYYEGGWYYTLYLRAGPGWQFSTCLTRSKDLMHWFDAPRDRVFLPFDPKVVSTLNATGASIHECNASDVELTYWKGKTLVYFCGGDQSTTSDLQRTEFKGTPRELFGAFYKDVPPPTDKAGRPLVHKLGTIDTDMVETQPIVFHDKLYRFESVRPNSPHNKTGKPYFRFVDVAADSATPSFAVGHALGCAIVDNDTMYVFGAPGWGASTIDVFWSKDLTHWQSATALQTDHWQLYNTSVCKAGDKFVMAFEIGAPPDVVGHGFTNRFAESKDLKTWTILPEPAVFTKAKYSACPTIRFVDGWYYVIYLEATGNYQFNPFIVRSRDLKTWQSSPLNPMIHFDDADKRIASMDLTDEQKARIAKALNRNNSDWDYCTFNGKLIINYSWGDQAGHEFLAEAEYNGGLSDFLEGWFPATSP